MSFEEIKTVKEINNKKGYLINNCISFMIADENSELLDSVKQWVKDGGIIEPEFTDEEIAQISLNKAIQEAQSLLDSTQFKFGEDYDKKYTSEWLELKEKRQEAREFIRLHSS